MHPRWWSDPTPAEGPPARLRRVVLRTPMLATAVEFFGGILEGEIEHESETRVDLVWARGARIGLEHRPDAPPGVDRLEVEGLAEEQHGDRHPLRTRLSTETFGSQERRISTAADDEARRPESRERHPAHEADDAGEREHAEHGEADHGAEHHERDQAPAGTTTPGAAAVPPTPPAGASRAAGVGAMTGAGADAPRHLAGHRVEPRVETRRGRAGRDRGRLHGVAPAERVTTVAARVLLERTIVDECEEHVVERVAQRWFRPFDAARVGHLIREDPETRRRPRASRCRSRSTRTAGRQSRSVTTLAHAARIATAVLFLLGNTVCPTVHRARQRCALDGTRESRQTPPVPRVSARPPGGNAHG